MYLSKSITTGIQTVRVQRGNTYNLDELGFQLMMIKILVMLIKEGIGIKLEPETF